MSGPQRATYYRDPNAMNGACSTGVCWVCGAFVNLTVATRRLEVRCDLHDAKASHVHAYGPVETARFTGNPHRKCACGVVSLDLGDSDDD